MKKKVGVVVVICVMLLGTSTLAEINTSFSEKNETFVLPTKQSLLQNENYDMVIISPGLFSAEIQRLVEHKNAVGLRTFLKTTEEIYAEFDGRDNAEQIKYFIKHAIENWGTEYALLVGDIHITPIRKTEVNQIWPGADWSWIQTDDIITDFYYADIYDSDGNFCSWDSNNDNVFSEYYLYNLGANSGERVMVDEVDLYPDIGVGRIPCENTDELEIVINKIITYETQGDDDWFHTIILAGSDGFPEPGNQGEMVTEHISELLTGFTQIKLYESLDNLNPESINTELNNGAGFFMCSSHGGPGGFHTYRKMDVKGLHNEQKLPIVFLTGCYCAQLDNSIISFLDAALRVLCLEFSDNPRFREKLEDFLQIVNTIEPQHLQSCIAWELLKHEYGGSIATIGGTRSGTLVRHDPPSGFTGFFSIKFFESYEPGITLSKMYNAAVISFIDDSWKNFVTLQRFILLGDPSLKIGGYP